MKKIKLISNSFNNEEIINLSNWLLSSPTLTQGSLNTKFENEFSNIVNKKYSVFVNSGSSANLLMIYSLILLNKLKNNKIVVPAISWSTSISPIIQFNLNPIICDSDINNFGVDIKQLEEIFIKENPSAFLSVNILGFSPDYMMIEKLCKKYDVILLNDNCESLGSTFNNKQLSEYGLISTHSFYYSHQLCTVEGGMICTNDKKIYNILKMIREHGWDRSLNEKEQKKLRKENNISDFKSLYTFYYPAFCVRNTQISAFLGLSQLKRLNEIIKKRFDNFKLYQKLIKNEYWKINPHSKNTIISNFAYPIIHPNKNDIIKKLKENNIECRPIVAGNMAKQPFIKNSNSIIYNTNNADIIDEYGFYLPNNPDLTKEEIIFICDIINKGIKK